MQDYNFKLQLSVRDYECDIQGIVNNAVYQNYLEHARHEYLKSVGVNFNDLTQKGINLVVVRVELDYKSPLKSGDQFVVGVNFVRESRLKFAFHQDIYRLEPACRQGRDEKLVIKGKIIGTALNQKGRPEIPPEINQLFQTSQI